MSFGIGTGDILATSKLARDIWRKFRDSPSQFKAIREEVANLTLVLEETRNIDGPPLTRNQANNLASITGACRSTLEDLSVALGKQDDLDSKPSSLRAKTRILWTRLNWDQKKIDEWRARVVSVTVTLDAFSTSLSNSISQGIYDKVSTLSEGVNHLQLAQDEKEFQSILEWLSPLEFPAQQSDYIQRRQYGTGEWLLESKEFTEWLVQPQATLICTGIPGAGKTMLASIVIDHLWNKFLNEDAGVAYIFCNYKVHLEQTPVNLITSLSKQLLQKKGTVSEELRKIYRCHIIKGTKATLEEIVQILHAQLSNFSQTFVVIDALDECSEFGNLLDPVRRLQSLHPINLMVTSRHVPNIMDRFPDAIRLEIRASEADVQRYVASQLPRLATCVIGNQTLQEVVIMEIVEATDGMFLLAQLHVDALVDKTSPKAIKTALKALPRGSDALDLACDQAMERIHDQKPGFSTLAKRVLSFIIYAIRPLRVSELQHALAVEIGEPTLDEENITDIREVVSVCAGLVLIGQNDSLQLVHYTAQEYFKRFRSRYFPDARQNMAATCLTYLTLDKFKSGPCKSPNEYSIRRLENPFYVYASRNWGYHAREDTENTCMDLMLKFLMNNPLVLSSFDASKPLLHRRVGWIKSLPWSTTGLHLAAFWGLDAVVPKLLEPGALLNVKDWLGRTPLAEAVAMGHNTTVAVFLAQKDIDVNTKDRRLNTPLHTAAESGSVAMVETLLSSKGIDVNFSNQDGWSPLLSAILSKAMEIVEILLAREDINLDQQGFGGHTALSAAIDYHGSVQLVKKLLAKGASIDCKTDTKATVLHLVARRGHSELLQMLLEARKDSIVQMINAPDDCGLTPAAVAAENGHSLLLQTLLTINALPDINTNTQQTCLHIAAGKGELSLVQILLDFGADLRHQDAHGWDAISFAQAYGREAVYRRLLLSYTDHSYKSAGIPPSRYIDASNPSLPSLDEDGLVFEGHSREYIIEYPEALDENRTRYFRQLRGNHPIPFEMREFYFEMTVKDQGDRGYVAIGFCEESSTRFGLPGWSLLSWGYHGDDGKVFQSRARGREYGLAYGTGDVVGCGINLETNSAFFTKNGLHLGTAFVDIRGRLFPVIGLGGNGTCVSGNFGITPFIYRGQTSSESGHDSIRLTPDHGSE